MTDFAYKITAQADGFLAGFAQAAAAAKAGNAQITASVRTMSESYEGLKAKVLAVSALLAGGAMFKGVVDDTVKLHVETEKLGREFGVSQNRALALRTAVNDMHVPTETLSLATAKLAIGLGDGGTKFEQLGVKVKDGNGQFLDMTQIMTNVNARILSFKEGADRNAISAQFYGKSWQEVSRILGLTEERLQEAAAKAKALGLELHPEEVNAYRDAMNDAGDSAEALKVKIGTALLPMLTDLAKWFSQDGPNANGIFIQAIKHLIQFVDETVVMIRLVWNDLATGAEKIMKRLETLGAVARAAATGQWDQIKQIWEAGRSEWQAMESKWLAQYYRLNREHLDRVERLWDKHKASRAADTPPTGGGAAGLLKRVSPEGPTRPSRVPQWENELREMETVQAELARRAGRFREQSLAEEERFWQSKLAMVQGNGKAEVAERTAVLKKIYDLRLGQFRQEFEAEIAANRAREEAAQNNTARRVAIAEKEVAMVGQRYGTQSKQYLEAEARVTELKRQALAQRMAMEMTAAAVERDRILARIDMAEQDAQAQVQLQRITADQMLILQERFENQRRDIKRRYAQMDRDTVDRDLDPAAYQERTARIEEIEIAHQNALADIKRRAMLEQQAPSTTIWTSMTDAFGQAVDQMVMHGGRMRDALQGIFKATAASFVHEMITKRLVAVATAAVQESGIWSTLFGSQQALQQGTSAAILSTKAAEASGVVSSNAAEAASGGAASQAAIPIVGPGLAIAAFATIMALVLGAKSMIKSAARGYDIPAGVNPVTQLHEQEMVLPRDQANAVRDMAKGRRGGSGTVLNVQNHFIVAGGASERTQQQIAREAGIGIQRAMARLG